MDAPLVTFPVNLMFTSQKFAVELKLQIKQIIVVFYLPVPGNLSKVLKELHPNLHKEEI